MTPKAVNNSRIANLLRQVAAAYEVKGGNRFKVIAYLRAADAIEHATGEVKDLWEDNNLDRVAGIGKSLQKHLEELFKTGKVKHFEQVMHGLPDGMFTLIGIPGIGPKVAYQLASKLNIKNTNDLKKAAEEGKIRELEGFGVKSEQEISQNLGLQRKKVDGKRMVLSYASVIAGQIIEYMLKSDVVKRVDALGSLRRQVSTVGDIDIAAVVINAGRALKHFTLYPKTAKVIESGTRTSSIRLESGIQIDLMVSPLKGYGALLQHFTGSKQHNIKLREIALKKGLSLSDFGIKKGNKLETYDTEEQLYKRLGMQFIPPEIREDNGEIEAAMQNKIPLLVELKDIKGDLHLHSNYPIKPSHDFGTGSFEDIIRKAKELGYEYIGLSDHSPAISTNTEKQIYDLVKKRSENIEHLKYSHKNIRILNLLEIDVLAHGELALNDKTMELLDGVIAGIHSSFDQSKKMMTKRMLGAIKNPHVKIIAHPTGRLLNKREGYEVNWPEVFEASIKHGTILEVNAWPQRLDLRDDLVFDAIAAGVKLVIDTDSHDIGNMDQMKFGVSVARRGWATKKDIVNTYDWVDFKKYFG